MPRNKSRLLRCLKTVPQTLTQILPILRHPLFSIILVSALIFAFLLLGPRLKVRPFQDSLSAQQRVELENDTLRSWGQVLGIFGGIVLLFLTWRRIEVAQEGQITERFTKATDQLGVTHEDGKTKILEIRLGGIYALERIAWDSKRDHWPIMEVLTAYVRTNAPVAEKEKQKEKQAQEQGGTQASADPRDIPSPDVDIQAILTVLGRRKLKHEKRESQFLDLSKTDLGKVVLNGVPLERADLSEANLEKANLREANLQKAYLLKANLQEADLRGANLSRASGLTVKQLSEAKVLTGATFDPELEAQLKKNHPHLFE